MHASGLGSLNARAVLALALSTLAAASHAGGLPGPAPSDQWSPKGRLTARDTFSLRADALTYMQVGRRLVDTSVKIIGGEPAPTGAYPWQVSIGVAGVPQTVGHFCGGALVSATWVLTAAHCLKDVSAPEQIQVKLGTNILGEGGEIVKVATTVVHPQWDPVSFVNDLALVQLATPSSGVAARLLEPGMAADLFADAALVVASGWGYMRDNKFLVSNVLRHVWLQVVSNATCNGPQSYPGQITDEMVCAGFIETARDACQVDSGGPLMAVDKKGGFVLAGIASWGRGCTQPNLYGVYTRVAAYAAWIKETAK